MEYNKKLETSTAFAKRCGHIAAVTGALLLLSAFGFWLAGNPGGVVPLLGLYGTGAAIFAAFVHAMLAGATPLQPSAASPHRPWEQPEA